MTIIQNVHYYTLYTPVVQALPQTCVTVVPPLFACLLGLPAEEDVDLLLYPVFIVWLVCLSISTVTREKKRINVTSVCPVVRPPEELHKQLSVLQRMRQKVVYRTQVIAEVDRNCHLSKRFPLFPKNQLPSRS